MWQITNQSKLNIKNDSEMKSKSTRIASLLAVYLIYHYDA